jgi:hypothetical protein
VASRFPADAGKSFAGVVSSFSYAHAREKLRVLSQGKQHPARAFSHVGRKAIHQP